jgi:hypothetical protein
MWVYQWPTLILKQLLNIGCYINNSCSCRKTTKKEEALSNKTRDRFAITGTGMNAGGSIFVMFHF